MVKNTPIVCSHCGRESGHTQKELIFLVIYHDLYCKYCGKIVIYANNSVIW